MSEHDYNLINQTGANLRADLNSVLLAIVSQNSSATEPATMFAYMFWADTSTGILKQRNAANSAWISLFTIATGAWLGNAATATLADAATTIAGTAGEKLPSLSVVQAAGALTFSSAAQYRDFRDATLTTGSPTTLYTAPANLVLPSGGTLGFTTAVEGTILVAEMNNAGTKELAICNKVGGHQLDESNLISTTAIGTGSDSTGTWYSTTARTSLPYRIIGRVSITNTAGAWGDATLIQPAGGLSLLGAPMMRATATIATTSGTEHDFTGIPDWAREIIVTFNKVSLSGTNYTIIQIGDASGFVTTGYEGSTGILEDAVAINATTTITSGFAHTLGSAGRLASGSFILTRDGESESWACSGSVGSSSGTGITCIYAGRNATTTRLTQIRITRSGADTFDGGSVSLLIKGY